MYLHTIVRGIRFYAQSGITQKYYLWVQFPDLSNAILLLVEMGWNKWSVDGIRIAYFGCLEANHSTNSANLRTSAPFNLPLDGTA